MADACVPTQTHRRSYRSAIVPPKGDNTNTGIVDMKPTIPSRAVEPVNW